MVILNLLHAFFLTQLCSTHWKLSPSSDTSFQSTVAGREHPLLQRLLDLLGENATVMQFPQVIFLLLLCFE